jgi:acyl carrier protein
MKPLAYEGFWTTQPSKTEKCLMWLPIIGWTFAAMLEQARFQPMVRSIEQQLRDRPDTSQLWGAEPDRQRVSSTMRKIAQEECGWPNDRFIPADPLDIVLWGHKDGLDSVSAVMRIEKEFSFRFPDPGAERSRREGTLGELVDRLLAKERSG